MTSITLDQEIKDEHEQLKPDSLTWNDYMHIVAHSIDAERFEQLVDELYQREYEAAVERARERYAEARDNPDKMLSAEDARDAVRERSPS